MSICPICPIICHNYVCNKGNYTVDTTRQTCQEEGLIVGTNMQCSCNDKDNDNDYDNDSDNDNDSEVKTIVNDT